MRLFALATGLLMCAACAARSPEGAPAQGLVFLTRDGCGNTALFRANLNEALRRMGLAADYLVVDLAALPAGDARRGYPTPTLLYVNRDLFGMREPVPPFPEPA
jgi:hypothetical protein